MRLRITFSKTAAMRYTSHLDLYRAWERTFRRAGLPLAYSKGYKPHPKLNFASALPLGFTSSAEVLDVWLERELDLDDISSSISRSLPPGISISHITMIALEIPSLQSQLMSSEYIIALSEKLPDLQDKINVLLAAESIPRQIRNKNYDLRPLIERLDYQEDNLGGSPILRMQVTAREGATGRPDEVLLELGIDPASTHIQRTSLIFNRM